MGVRLVKDKDDAFVTVDKLKDGQLAEIMEGRHAGKIVQRRGWEGGDKLISIGRTAGVAWAICDKACTPSFQLRILMDGELIEVVDNQ